MQLLHNNRCEPGDVFRWTHDVRCRNEVLFRANVRYVVVTCVPRGSEWLLDLEKAKK